MNLRSPNFQTEILGVAAILLLAASAISVDSPFSNANARIAATPYTSETLPQRDLSLQHARKFLRFAQTHADICLQNEQTCLQGCDGATSCSNQCATNYQGCMDQGG